MSASTSAASTSAAPPTSAPTRPRSPVSTPLILILALLTAVSPLATDMYLPAFPEMADELGTSATSIQLTLTAFLLGMGVGQLLIGPLSDSIGRRKPLLVGSVVCLVATVACAVAPNVELLTVARLVQGLSGAAGVVLARAIISDTARGAAAAKLIGVMMVIMVIAPVVAPLAGGAIVASTSWRVVFWALSALTALMLLGAVTLAKETLPPSERHPGGFASVIQGARTVLANRSYVGYLLTFCFSFAALFAYISASPFVVQNVLGFSEGQFSLVFGGNALLVVLTSSVAAALAGRVSYRRMVVGGVTVMTLASVGLLVSALSGLPTVPTLVLFAIFQGSLGFIFSNATALALAQVTSHAGTGSAFLGFVQFLLAAAITPLVGIGGEHTAVPMAVAMLVCTVLSMLAFATLTPRAETPVVEQTEALPTDRALTH
ncbi:multidrug effflux MFS transporter [Rhodococcus sp. X156]|uniref:multidrug effflux MFS transporter n=1 Tax=Rhodococcus sp. X156 TaxID=2499145 RepID=UPI000FDC845B|nr:multidrug effflux MFS transporter [Rhodococcus sp. X156]